MQFLLRASSHLFRLIETFVGAHHATSPGWIRGWGVPSGPISGVLLFVLLWPHRLGSKGVQ